MKKTNKIWWSVLKILAVLVLLGSCGQLFAGDIGSVGTAGSDSYNAGTGVYTISGAGAGVTGAADAFYFYDDVVSGDCEITVRVDSLTSFSNSNGQVGVMVRDSLNANAINANLYVTYGNVVNFSYRTSTGGATTTSSAIMQSVPVWLRITQVGNTTTGYMSTDGASWTQVGQSTVTLSSTYYMGMSVSSAISGTLGTAAFSRVNLTTNFPAAMSGLKLWLRADQGITKSSGAISAAADQSGSSHDATQSTSGNQPSWQDNILSGKPIMRFDGTNDYLSVADHTDLKPTQLTVFMVANYTTATSNHIFFAKSNSSLTNGYGFYRNAGNSYGYINNYSSEKVGGTFAAATFALLSLKYDLVQVSTKINGTEFTDAYTTAINHDTSPFYLGSQAGVKPNQMDMAEVLFFNRALSDAERSDIEAYFYSKYGVGTQPTIATPVASTSTPLPSVYSGSQSIAVDPVAGAAIYYTTDGSEPTQGGGTSTLYTGAVSISSSATAKFKAFKFGYADSSSLAFSYTIDSASVFTRSGLALWLRADQQVTANGSNVVSEWDDLSGNANNALQATGANQPLLVSGAVNSKPVIRFDGTSDVMSIANNATLNPSNQLTVFVVGKKTSSTGDGVFLVKGAGTTAWTSGYGLVDSTTNGYGFVNSWSGNKVGGTLAANTYGILSLLYDGTGVNSSGVRTSVNGTVYTNTYSTVLTNSTTALYLGASNTSSRLGGDIAEVLLFQPCID